MRRRSTRTAWWLLAVFAASAAALVALSAANGTLGEEPLTDTVALLLAFGAFMVVGALVVAHRPGNAVGWMFAAVALLASTGALAMEDARYAAVTRPGALPGAALAAWYASWTWYPALALVVVFTPLVFPTGRLLSPRWRLVAWPAAVATAAITVLSALQRTVEVAPGRVVANPLGLAAVEDPEQSRVGAVLLNLIGPAVILAFASLVVRFRRSRGDERQQLKWITYAAALLPLIALDDLLPDAVSSLLFATMIALLPTAAGVAILRYRLYEIDWLINRTLVYGLLTVVLAGVYAGLVLALGQLFGGIGSETPSWVVAAATLAVAALFQPARRRIQESVDQRFNRRRYDAARTVRASASAFASRSTWTPWRPRCWPWSNQTVEPTRSSLWLRGPPPRGAGSRP